MNYYRSRGISLLFSFFLLRRCTLRTSYRSSIYTNIVQGKKSKTWLKYENLLPFAKFSKELVLELEMEIQWDPAKKKKILCYLGEMDILTQGGGGI